MILVEQIIQIMILKVIANGVKIRKSKTGYESVNTIYICEDCSNCNYKSQCIKGNNSKIPLEKRTKKFETSKNLIVKGKNIQKELLQMKVFYLE